MLNRPHVRIVRIVPRIFTSAFSNMEVDQDFFEGFFTNIGTVQHQRWVPLSSQAGKSPKSMEVSTGDHQKVVGGGMALEAARCDL